MGKKAAKPGSEKQTQGDVDDDTRVAAVVLKGSREYRDWLTGMSRTTLIPVAAIVRDALSKWAADKGFSPPPADK